ncbi:metallophosphoesterase family protein [Verrucomicrobium spinosum]|uniref:metallophosphoesterase family protein n=1 Tax=Verrucomicrobium spinosum TaxID=2736 RepID=UPI0001745388|nr:metallophosphoesterase [Verrucomicrobium spinosum]
MPVTLAPSTSRRRFLAQSAAAVCFGWSSRFLGAQATPGADNVWALFSDTHIDADPLAVSRGVTMAANLRSCVAEVLARAERPAGLILSGDCAHLKGMRADYQTLKPLLQPLVAAKLPVHLLMGNHDDRVAVTEVLDCATSPAVPSRFVSVQETPHANWFLLDSLDKVNSTPGVLGGEQLAWLGRELDARSDRPAVIVVHHNITLQESKTDALLDSTSLLELLRPRRQVKACIYGHTHRWSHTEDESGLHFINLPPVAYVFKQEFPNGWVLATLQPDALRLELRALDANHPQHGEVKTLKWRV